MNQKVFSVHDLTAATQRAVIRMTAVIKEAVLPSRCLICGSFFIPSCVGDVDPVAMARDNPGDTAQKDGDQPDFSGVEGCLSGRLARFSFEALLAPYLCHGCLTGFGPVRSPLCTMCGIMFKSREDTDHLCGDCIRQPKKFYRARAAGLYTTGFIELVHKFKYAGKTRLAIPFGMLLLAAYLRHWKPDDIDLIIPVPLHRKRLRQRGFNQAFLLVSSWGRIAGELNIRSADITIEKNTLVRKRHTAPQTGLGRADRKRNIKQAFSIAEPAKINNRRLLLIDDVYTTGATVNECAAVLLKNGAERVDVLTLARAV